MRSIDLLPEGAVPHGPWELVVTPFGEQWERKFLVEGEVCTAVRPLDPYGLPSVWGAVEDHSGRDRDSGGDRHGHNELVVVGPLPPKDGMLKVTCWCERQVVLVADEDVVKGITLSCGRSDCSPPSSDD